MKKIYLIGSLRNPEVPVLGRALREIGFDVFDDWYAAGPRADDHWQEYEVSRGHDYREAIYGLSAGHVFHFDDEHIRSSDIGILLLPAGKSGHIELGVLAGLGKRTYVLFDKVPDRYDVMYRYFTDVFFDKLDLIDTLKVPD
jgi:nucleoside 2-deoxyribosyltransferase